MSFISSFTVFLSVEGLNQGWETYYSEHISRYVIRKVHSPGLAVAKQLGVVTCSSSWSCNMLYGSSVSER